MADPADVGTLSPQPVQLNPEPGAPPDPAFAFDDQAPAPSVIPGPSPDREFTVQPVYPLPTNQTVRQIPGQALLGFWHRIDIQRPTFLRPHRVVSVNGVALQGTDLQEFKTYWSPRQGSGGDLYNPDIVFHGHQAFGGGCMYFPAPGIYYVSLHSDDFGAANFVIEYTDIDVTCPWVMRTEMDASKTAIHAEGYDGVGLTAATTVLLDIDEVMQAKTIRVTNTDAANAALLNWGNQGGSMLLLPRETIVFGINQIPMANLNGTRESADVTAINITVYR